MPPQHIDRYEAGGAICFKGLNFNQVPIWTGPRDPHVTPCDPLATPCDPHVMPTWRPRMCPGVDRHLDGKT
eukprot:6789146-Prymnesium_polylepis.2